MRAGAASIPDVNPRIGVGAVSRGGEDTPGSLIATPQFLRPGIVAD